MLLNVRARSSGSQIVESESWKIEPDGDHELIVTQPELNRFDRVRVSAGEFLTLTYEAVVETHPHLLDPETLRKVAPDYMDHTLIPFLIPSRYCQSDRLGRLAWQKFGKITAVYDQVMEITRWINETVEYIPGTTDSATSAYDTVTQCAGVCRDFAHLGIALCRALTIPARYFTGYAYRLEPPDFHACFEAFIGGRWVLFDPTHLASPNGLVRIGSGRDAADVSVCTAFGIVSPGLNEIRCDAMDPSFEPLSLETLQTTAVCLD
jgi:transglutaminase-like putative cysteine protease